MKCKIPKEWVEAISTFDCVVDAEDCIRKLIEIGAIKLPEPEEWFMCKTHHGAFGGYKNDCDLKKYNPERECISIKVREVLYE